LLSTLFINGKNAQRRKVVVTRTQKRIMEYDASEIEKKYTENPLLAYHDPNFEREKKNRFSSLRVSFMSQ
jgi:hypothetical protein